MVIALLSLPEGRIAELNHTIERDEKRVTELRAKLKEAPGDDWEKLSSMAVEEQKLAEKLNAMMIEWARLAEDS
jgi:hypothetical protein